VTDAEKLRTLADWHTGDREVQADLRRIAARLEGPEIRIPRPTPEVVEATTRMIYGGSATA